MRDAWRSSPNGRHGNANELAGGPAFGFSLFHSQRGVPRPCAFCKGGSHNCLYHGVGMRFHLSDFHWLNHCAEAVPPEACPERSRRAAFKCGISSTEKNLVNARFWCKSPQPPDCIPDINFQIMSQFPFKLAILDL